MEIWKRQLSLRRLQRSHRKPASISSGCSCRPGKRACPPARSASSSDLPSATLAFHLKELKHAGLVTFTREGRSLIYAAVYPAMNGLLGYLTENCCQGNPAACGVAAAPQTSEAKGRGMTPAQLSELPVVIIGAGPVGLAAAAQLLARGAKPLVLEAGPEVGHNIRQWGHVGMFTPWRFCVDRAAEALARGARLDASAGGRCADRRRSCRALSRAARRCACALHRTQRTRCRRHAQGRRQGAHAQGARICLSCCASQGPKGEHAPHRGARGDRCFRHLGLAEPDGR